MATEETRTLVRELMEALDRRDIEGVVSYAAPEARWSGFGPQVLDNVGYRQAIGEFMTGFPDSRFPIDNIIADGDKAAVRHSLQGTHNGSFQGIPPTGHRVVVPAIAEFRVVNGQVVETYLVADFMGLMIQLGVIPPPGAPA